jgi:general secretion pathway protein F
MAVYEYRGLDPAGRDLKGIIDADSPRLARAKLRRSGIFPTEILIDRHMKKSGVEGVSIGALVSRISIQEISIMTRQMATLVGAGLPIVEALTALIDQTENVRLKKVITQVRESVNEGSSLADAMRQFPKVFSELYANMINAGESSGALDIVLKRLADFMENQVMLRNKVLATLTYPIILVLVGIAILSFLLVFVVPKVVRIFDDLQQVGNPGSRRGKHTCPEAICRHGKGPSKLQSNDPQDPRHGEAIEDHCNNPIRKDIGDPSQ